MESRGGPRQDRVRSPGLQRLGANRGGWGQTGHKRFLKSSVRKLGKSAFSGKDARLFRNNRRKPVRATPCLGPGEIANCLTPEALQPIAPGRAKHAPGEWCLDLESAPRRGAKTREAATPAGVGDSLGARTRGCFAPRATRFNASGVPQRHDHQLRVAAPAVTTFIQNVTRSHALTRRAMGLFRELRAEQAFRRAPTL